MTTRTHSPIVICLVFRLRRLRGEYTMQDAVCLGFCEWTSRLLHPYFCVLRHILVLPPSTFRRILSCALHCFALLCPVLFYTIIPQIPAASPRATPPAAATVPNNRKTPLHQSTPLPSNKKSRKTQSEIQISTRQHMAI